MNNLIFNLFIVCFFNIKCLKSQSTSIRIDYPTGDPELERRLRTDYFQILTEKFQLTFSEVEARYNPTVIKIEKRLDNHYNISVFKENDGNHKPSTEIKVRTKTSDYSVVIENASEFLLGMLLDADTSIYSKIARFDEAFMEYLPDTARERHAHHFFCITKKDYRAGNSFFNRYFKKSFNCSANKVAATVDCIQGGFFNQYRYSQSQTNNDWTTWQTISIRANTVNLDSLKCFFNDNSKVQVIKLHSNDIWNVPEQQPIIDFLKSKTGVIIFHIIEIRDSPVKALNLQIYLKDIGIQTKITVS